MSWIEIITSEPLELLLDIAEDNPSCIIISLVIIILLLIISLFMYFYYG